MLRGFPLRPMRLYLAIADPADHGQGFGTVPPFSRQGEVKVPGIPQSNTSEFGGMFARPHLACQPTGQRPIFRILVTP